jgi:hypothetical protein
MTTGTNNFAANQNSRQDPGRGSVLLVHDDTNELATYAQSLYVTVGGTVKFTCVDGTVDTWTVPDNFIIPLQVKIVWSNGTTATGVHAIL